MRQCSDSLVLAQTRLRFLDKSDIPHLEILGRSCARSSVAIKSLTTIHRNNRRNHVRETKARYRGRDRCWPDVFSMSNPESHAASSSLTDFSRGVAYSIGPDWSDPRTLNRWPSVHGIEQADKVATRVGYGKNRSDLRNWGFECVFGEENVDVREQFKLTLDHDYEDDRGFSCRDARKWYLDYLSCLHREIEKFFDTSVPRWRELHVEYSFSTPTTWKNPAMIASIEKLVRAAGFADNGKQTVRMALTEAEAAAIEASTTQYREGDIFLICDVRCASVQSPCI